MKKNIIFFTLLMFTMPIFSQDGYNVSYFISRTTPHGSIDNLSTQAKQMAQKLLDAAKSVRYTLTINEKSSYFSADDFFSIGESTSLDQIYFDLAKKTTLFNKEIYSNYSNKQMTFVKDLVDKDFIVKTDLIDFKWKLINEEKTIANLNAYKAVGTYFDPIKNKEAVVIAWYVPSIPISGGPDIFMGLPGLIAEVELKGAIVTVEKLEEIKNLEINKIDDSKAMTSNEYHNLIKNLTGKFIDGN